MRILGYIGTYNEGVERSLQALRAQTRPLDQILIVDNASTRDAPEGPFPAGVTRVRNARNLGPSGAITRGFEFALEGGFDWMWIFDADSAPRPDALEHLVHLYASRSAGERERVGLLGPRHALLPSERLLDGRRFTSGGPRLVRIDPERDHYECDAVIWSGSLYRMSAVREIGMPRHGRVGFWEDLGHDYGDFEFSHRLRRAGWRILVHRGAIIDQQVGESREIRVLGQPVFTTNHPAGRRYLYFRNLVYYWSYLHPTRSWLGLGVWFSYRLGVTIVKIAIAESDRRMKIAACLRGSWDGLRRRMSGRWDGRPAARAAAGGAR